VSEDDWGAFLRSCEQPPAVESAGPLTAGTMRRWLDELWQPRRPVIPRGHRDLLEDLLPEPGAGYCRAVLLAPDDSLGRALRAELSMRGIAVHPAEAAYLNSPVQGPTPLRCELDEHPAGTWHRDGRTWFQ
jgi:hypothetical protein